MLRWRAASGQQDGRKLRSQQRWRHNKVAGLAAQSGRLLAGRFVVDLNRAANDSLFVAAVLYCNVSAPELSGAEAMISGDLSNANQFQIRLAGPLARRAS